MEVEYGPQRAGYISTDNSTTSTLTSGSTFTGAGEDVSEFSSISLTSTSDVVSADSGLTLEFSSDGTNWDRQLIAEIKGKASYVHTLRVINKFFRVVYINGGTNQASFRLQVIYHSTNAMPLISRTGQPQSTIDAEVVRQATDIDLDYARKHIPGGREFFFFGANNALQDGVFEDVWNGGGDIQWQTTAAKVKAQSTNAADTPTGPGVGLQSIEIHGLSSTGVDQDEVLALNGVNAVESALLYLRVSLVHNEVVGTYGGSHEGNIEVRVTNETFSNGALLASLTGLEGLFNVSPQYGLGEAQNGFTTIPLGKVAYITSLEVIPKTAKPITVILYEREGILTTSDPFLPRRVIWLAEEIIDPIEKVFKSHIKIKALTDLWFRAEGNGQASGVAVTLNYYLIDEDASGA